MKKFAYFSLSCKADIQYNKYSSIQHNSFYNTIKIVLGRYYECQGLFTISYHIKMLKMAKKIRFFLKLIHLNMKM